MTPPRNRKSPRKKDYDYNLSGAYFVTICTHERELLFGDVIDDVMQRTSLGQIAHDCWLTTPDHFPDVEIDCFVVMPNHVHAIIVIHDRESKENSDNNNNPNPNNTVGNGDQSPDNHNNPNANNTVGTRHALSLHTPNEPKYGVMKNGRFYPAGVKPRSLGAIVGSYKSAVTKIANRTLDDPPSFLWQSRYHDHIIRNEKEWNIIRQYVHTNPARWNEDQFNA